MQPKSIRFVVFFSFLCCLLFTSYCLLSSAVPQQMAYQGKVTDTDGISITDTLDIAFSIWNSDVGGDSLWSETQLAVPIIKGLFDVQLGSVNPIALSFDATYWLQIIIDGDRLLPRTQLSTSPYAYRAVYADSIKGTGIIQGSGTDNYLAKWSGSDSLESSMVYQTATNKVGIGTFFPEAQFHVVVDEDSTFVDPPVYDFEEDTLYPFVHVSWDDADWFITESCSYSGTHCIQSGEIDNFDYSVIQLNGVSFVCDDSIKFALKVSSECADQLVFIIDEETKGQWYGVVDWIMLSFPVSAGTHDFTWYYHKNGSLTAGSDCAWIDLVSVGVGYFEGNSPDSAALYADGLNVAPSAVFMRGNVGIGVTNPTKKLDVNGEIQVMGEILARGSGDNYFAGRVGIGTTTPNKKLDVMGEIQATGSGDNYFAGRIGIRNDYPSSFFSDFDDLVVGDTLGRNGITIATDSLSRGTLAFADGAAGPARYSGLIYYDHLNDGMYFTTNGQGWAEGDNAFVINDQGNVGIGTLNPTRKLHVVSDSVVAIYGFSTNFHAIDGVSSGVSCAGVLGATASSSSWGVYGYDDSGGIAVRGLSNSASGTAGYFTATEGGYGLIVNQGNVGIGETTPSQKLDVNGNAHISGNLTVDGTYPIDNDWTITGSNLYSAVPGKVGIGNSYPSRFYTDFNDLVVGNGSGRHGITIYSDSLARGMLAFADDTIGTSAFSGLIYYDHAIDGMIFTTKSKGYADGLDACTIDSIGNVGIGSLTPGGQLHLAGAGNEGINAEGIKLLISQYDNDDTFYTYPIYVKDENDNADFYLRSRSTGAGKSMAYFQGDVGIGNQLMDGFYNGSNDLVVGSGTQNHGITIFSDENYKGLLAFAKDTTETGAYNGLIYYDHSDDKLLITTAGEGYPDADNAFVIDATGDVGIGETSPTYKLHVNGTAYSTGGWTGSDKDFKTDINAIQNPLDLVSALNPVKYQWKEGMESYGIEGGRYDYGFIAQELQQVLPELVREGADEHHLAVNYDHITAVNTAAIKELLEKIKALEARIQELESSQKNE
ncbi:tail fiber domain-containing protein [bacterium]|nr:tail fiber domain-containing protein [bacterium]